MNYQESLNYLLERLPMFQRVGKAALKKDLTNTLKMLEALGNPHHRFQSIHIAGTNGKGTSAHALASVMKAAGYRTGLYTSPHLKSFTERIRIDGVEVAEDFVAEFTTKNRTLIEDIRPSFFEVTVVMAFEYFRQENVDVAVIETGLGGRLDSTNVILPVVSLITMIGYDHMDLLGDTLEKIAAEKAGIIKKNTPVVIGNNQLYIRHVFEKVAQTQNAALHTVDDYGTVLLERSFDYCRYRVMSGGKMVHEDLKTDLTAAYFGLNIPGILKTIEVLNQQGFHITAEEVRKGFETIRNSTGLKGRMQMIAQNPMVLADISHNQPGLSVLFDQINKELRGSLHVIFGVVKDKDLSGIMSVLPPQAKYYWTQSAVPRSLPAGELKTFAEGYGFSGQAFPNVNEAISVARERSGEQDFILICGSAFVVAEIDDL